MSRTSELLAEFGWFPLFKKFALTICELPGFKDETKWCKENYIPFVVEADVEKDPSKRMKLKCKLMKNFVDSVRPFEKLLLERKSDFLGQAENKFVRCLCLHLIWKSPKCSKSLMSTIWDRLLGLHLVASATWRIPPALFEVFDEVIENQSKYFLVDKKQSFDLKDLTENGSSHALALLGKVMGKMESSELKSEHLDDAFNFCKQLINGGRTEGEKPIVDELLTVHSNGEVNEKFQSLLSVIRVFSLMSPSQLKPWLETLGDKVGVSSEEFEDVSFESFSKDNKMQDKIQNALKNPKITKIITDIQESKGDVNAIFSNIFGVSGISSEQDLKDMIEKKSLPKSAESRAKAKFQEEQDSLGAIFDDDDDDDDDDNHDDDGSSKGVAED